MFTKEFAKIKMQKEHFEEDVKDEFENYAPKCKKFNFGLGALQNLPISKAKVALP